MWDSTEVLRAHNIFLKPLISILLTAPKKNKKRPRELLLTWYFPSEKEKINDKKY